MSSSIKTELNKKTITDIKAKHTATRNLIKHFEN